MDALLDWVLHASKLLHGRGLYDEAGAAFDIDFTDRAAAMAVFEEGMGSLLTDGSRACMTPSHLHYNAELGHAGRRGLVIAMDDEDVTCGHDSEIAVGHLASRKGFSYGDFEWTARMHHAPG